MHFNTRGLYGAQVGYWKPDMWYVSIGKDDTGIDLS